MEETREGRGCFRYRRTPLDPPLVKGGSKIRPAQSVMDPPWQHVFLRGVDAARASDVVLTLRIGCRGTDVPVRVGAER